MEYRREIDGLRAIAVLPVIFYHAGFSWFSGGYVGVDIFFVISGYLITSILLKDLAEGKFSIVKFYERRARRILPVLALVMLCSIPFAWLWLLPSQFQNFSQAVMATSLFASNILFWRGSDYFAPAAEENPLIHTWSLAVEEQFYILFPIFLLLLWRFGRNITFYAVIFVSIISLALSEYGWRNYPTANFYLIITRAWELGAGAICAYSVFNKPVKSNSFLAFSGLLLIIYAIFYYDQATPFPSLYALAPVVGTALIIVFAGKGSAVAKLLSLKILVGIGLISYSAYLWHQPVFAFARIKSFGGIAPGIMLVLSFATLFLAYLSWRYVETPFRLGRISFFSSRRNVFASSAVGLAALLCFGLYGHVSMGAGWRDVGIQALSYEPDNEKLQRDSWDILKDVTGSKSYSVEGNQIDSKYWFYGAELGAKILVVGNSHSKDIFNVIYNSDYVDGDLAIARYGVQIFELADPDHGFYDSENFHSSDVVLVASRYRYEDIEALDSIIENIRSFGKMVALVENIFEFPEFGGGRNLADYVLFQLQEEKDLDSEPSLVSRIVNERYYSVYSSGKTSEKVIAVNKEIVSRQNQVVVLNRMDYVCASEENKCFAMNDHYEKYFYDYGHHTLNGAEFFGDRLKEIGWLDPVLKEHSNIAAREP
jgi:peptidoglycan/LPS O-acetylase OafA/YrhL